MRKENSKIKELVEIALSELIENDSDLIKRGVHERAIAFRFGYYLQYIHNMNQLKLSTKAVVDAEYNRNGETPKYVYNECKNCSSNYNCFIKYYFKTGRELQIDKDNKSIQIKEFKELLENISYRKFMIPDLIIHERMPNGNRSDNNKGKNHLVIEIKTCFNENDRAIDLAKLSYLTCKNADYHYSLGLYLEFSKTNNNSYIALEDGSIVERGTIVNEEGLIYMIPNKGVCEQCINWEGIDKERREKGLKRMCNNVRRKTYNDDSCYSFTFDNSQK